MCFTKHFFIFFVCVSKVTAEPIFLILKFILFHNGFFSFKHFLKLYKKNMRICCLNHFSLVLEFKNSIKYIHSVLQ